MSLDLPIACPDPDCENVSCRCEFVTTTHSYDRVPPYAMCHNDRYIADRDPGDEDREGREP